MTLGEEAQRDFPRQSKLLVQKKLPEVTRWFCWLWVPNAIAKWSMALGAQEI